MDLIYILSIVTILILIVLTLFIIYHQKKIGELKDEISVLDSAKRSQSSLYGKINEQFAPFMEKYPYEQKGFRFIGSPIDGIQFEEDKILLVEIKSAKSRLSPYQSKIKKMLQGQKDENKIVDWFEFNIK